MLDANPGKWDLSRMKGMLVGGSAAPRAMIAGFKQRHGLSVVHGWGMTETSPVASTAQLTGDLKHADEETQFDFVAMQGIPLPFVELRARVGDEEIPWDGEAMGELEVRGPWVAAAYYDTPEQADRWTDDGWFRTGDIVSIHPRGFIQIKDRSKDVIKSGGEWISSVELENALMAHPAVAEAAVIAVPDAKWAERPLGVVVLKRGTDRDERRAARLSRAAVREVVAAGALRVRRRDSEDERRQVPEDGVARPVRAGARARAAVVKAAVLREVDGPFERRRRSRSRRGREGRVVRVRAAGINFADVLIRRGVYPQMPELPTILGSEIAGELEDGTRVMAFTPSAGGYAELTAVDPASVVPLPANATFAEGASFLLTFLTAYIPLTRQVRMREGATVLVYAAAGGVGTAAIQVARALGAARVVAAAGSAEKLDVCRELGAEEAYVYDELPEDLQADVVDRPGRRRAVRRRRSPRLRPLGSVVAIGSAAGAVAGARPARCSSAATPACTASTSAG